MDPRFKQCPPRLARVFHPTEAVYFITANTHGRRPCLADPDVQAKFEGYSRAAAEFGVWVGRYVLMPDHVHLFVAPGLQMQLGRWMKGLKRALNPTIIAAGHQPHRIGDQALVSFWQPGFFDHKLRQAESYAAKWEYVRYNPVRAGLVSEPDLWPYQGEVYPLRL